MRGTLRTFKPEIQQLVRARMDYLVIGLAASYGAVAEVIHFSGLPALMKHEKDADLAAEVAAAISGLALRDIKPTMGGEKTFLKCY